ncbi:hypothetical protein PMAYCL1PPCAC_07768, partial [Pristionchus mayeri]
GAAVSVGPSVRERAERGVLSPARLAFSEMTVRAAPKTSSTLCVRSILTGVSERSDCVLSSNWRSLLTAS